MWRKLPDALRKTFIFNAPTFLDEATADIGIGSGVFVALAGREDVAPRLETIRQMGSER